MMKRLFILFAAVLAFASIAKAADPVPNPAPTGSQAEPAGVRTETETTPETEKANLFSFDGSVDISTGYYFRGYKYFSGGWNTQTDLTISLNEFKAGEFGITPYLNLWANVQEDTGVNDHNFFNFGGHLNEIDVNPGADITWDKFPNFTLEIQYNTNFFPSGTAKSLVGKGLEGQSQELVLTVKYGGDDDNLNFSKLTIAQLHPHVSYAIEFEDRGDGSRDSYLEFGFEPNYAINDKLSVSFPANLGFSTDSYYVDNDGHNEFLGYSSVGIHPKYQLTEHFDVHAGVDYIHAFSDGLAESNGERDSFVGSIGLGFSF